MADTIPKQLRIPSSPNLIVIEIAAAMLTLVAVCLLSAICDAPITGPADPLGTPPEGVKAPWIFVGIQQLLRYLPPIIAGVCLPLASIATISALPLVPVKTTLGRYTSACLLYGIGFGAIVVSVWGYLYE